MTALKKVLYSMTTGMLVLPVVVAAQYQKPNDTNLPETPGGEGIFGTLTAFMKWMLSLIGVLAVIAFVIAGIMYLTSMGNEDQAKSAKNAMIHAVIGVVVALLGLIILTAAEKLLKNETVF